jgi:cell division septation protein DedD
MEETNPTWKNHSFTLLIFGGIVALCSIFFVLGMLVGRNQGQKLAEIAFADEAARKPVAQNGGDEFPLDFYTQTTGEKPDLKLQPAPPESAATDAASAFAGPVNSGSSVHFEPLTDKPRPLEAKAKPAETKAQPAETKAQPTAKSTEAKNTETAKPAAARTPVSRDVFLQVTATQNAKQASEELKRVQSKGFKARILKVTQKNVLWHRIYVGPYTKSEVNLAKSDLSAKGYKKVVERE